MAQYTLNWEWPDGVKIIALKFEAKDDIDAWNKTQTLKLSLVPPQRTK